MIFFKDAENHFNLVKPVMDERGSQKKCFGFCVPGYEFLLQISRLKVINSAVINQRAKERRTHT